LEPDPDHAGRVRIWLLNSKNPLSFEKSRIQDVVAQPSPLDEYLTRRARASSDANAQYELGLWCERNKLSSLAPSHYEAAIAIDREFEPAHQKLGHTLHEGHWLTRDEMLQAQGLVKFRGKWVTPEEKSQYQSNVKLAGAQASMVRRFRLLRQAIFEGTEERRREAEEQLLKVRDPAAIVPLVRVFGDDVPESRQLLIRALGGIPGPEAASALVTQLLIESDNLLRSAALEELRNREDRAVEFRLTRALNSSNIAIVNRAAWAIGRLGLISAVPQLIPALISIVDQSVWVNSDGGPLASGVGSGIPSYSAYPMTGALIGANQSSIAVLTPPAVGPGAVAYGAVAVPFSVYAGVGYAPGTGFPPVSPLGGGVAAPPGPTTATPSRGPVMQLVQVPYRNQEVHDALVTLTGKDFGYNIDAWRSWLSREFNPNPDPARRVPQP
jgi:hypothetical protein